LIAIDAAAFQLMGGRVISWDWPVKNFVTWTLLIDSKFFSG